VSSTYPVPGSEQEYPTPRHPDLRLRVVPNESLMHWWPHLGELVQALVDVGADEGVSIELDTSDRTRPGEGRGGASPMPAIALVILEGAAGAVATELVRATVAWVRRHLPANADADQSVGVSLYAANGDVIRVVRVPRGEGGGGPVDETRLRDRLQEIARHVRLRRR
jgi:hypothetical protein